ncbi:MAG: UDP-N-acetylglucosamine 1-carboxyvinyltransferase, partial [Patescibacteria group bacterium]
MKFIIRGGKPLSGEFTLAGSKNTASKLMITSLLTDEPCTLTNFPRIGDAEITAELCRTIGSDVRLDGDTLSISTPKIKNSRVLELSRRNRIPILALAPLLTRAGEGEVPIVGGDKIGHRPVDLHIKALEALGAEIKVTPISYIARAKKGLFGGVINLGFPSVGATENAVLAAVCANGRTVIKNAALEPEIISMIKMLQNMGAIVELGAERDIYIEGVKHLRGVTHEVPSDRNEAVSFACLGIATGGDVFLKGAIQDHLITFLNVVRRMGATYTVT